MKATHPRRAKVVRLLHVENVEKYDVHVLPKGSFQVKIAGNFKEDLITWASFTNKRS